MIPSLSPIDALSFLTHVLPSEGLRCCTTIVRKGEEKIPKNHHFATNEEAVTFSMRNSGIDVYIACSTFKTNESRKQTNVAWIKAFWLDVDCGPEKDYPDKETAAKALIKFCQETGLPMPTTVVSGGGLHCWWGLTEAITPDRWKPAAMLLGHLTEKFKFKVDRSRTSDEASVLRLPGTNNWKTGNLRPVICEVLQPSVDTNTFLGLLNNHRSTMTISNADFMGGIKVAPDMTQGYPDGQRTDALLHRVGYCLGPWHMSEEDALTACLAWNQHNFPPLDEAKVESTVRSIASREAQAQAAEADALTAIIGETTQIPYGWIVKLEGVWYEKASGNTTIKVKVCGLVWVDGLTRTNENEGWGLVIKWQDRDGRIHQAAIKAERLHESKGDLCRELANDGLWIMPGRENKLLEYLASFKPSKRSRSVAQLGWIEGAAQPIYVLPQQVVPAREIDGEAIVFQPERHSPSSASIRAAGTPAEWQQHVASPCQGNPLLMFSVCTGFVGPLLYPSGIDNGGINFYGTTSRGKTTALQVAASVMGNGADPAQAGNKSAIRRWNTTGNGAEGLAAAHNDSILAMDELGVCQAKDFGAMIYMIAGGQGKTTLSQNRNMKPVRTWRLWLLSSGEISSRAKIAEGFQTPRGGQQIRILDIPISAEGLIQNPHELPPAQFADNLKEACGRYYGTAGPAFIEALITHFGTMEKMREGVIELVTALTAYLSPPQATPEQRRAIKRIALVMAAGVLAVKFGIIPFTRQEIAAACAMVRDLWLRDDVSASDALQGLISVKEFIQKNPGRFDANNGITPIRDLAGYKRDGLYLLTDGGFREACGGHDPKVVARELKALGFLFMNDGIKFKSRHTILGQPDRLSLYAVKPDLLAFEVQVPVFSGDNRDSGTDG